MIVGLVGLTRWAGPDPGLIEELSWIEDIYRRAKVASGNGPRKRTDLGVVANAREGQCCRQPRHTILAPSYRLVDGAKVSVVGPDRAPIYAFEVRSSASEGSGDHLRGIERVNPQTRLGVLERFGAIRIRDHVYHINHRSACRRSHRHQRYHCFRTQPG